MATTPLKIYKSELLKITDGEIEEKFFTRTANLRLRYSLQHGSLKPEVYSFKGLNVLWVAYDVNDTSKKYIIAKLLEYGATISNPMSQSDFQAQSASTLKSSYDIVVVDMYVWAVQSSSMTKAKECADEGLVVVTSGNDTLTNLFFTAVSISNEDTHLAITSYNVSHITKTRHGESIGSLGTDPNYYASNLNYGAKQLYYHSDIDENATMGFIYEPNNGLGGSLIHDQAGTFSSIYFNTRFKYFIFYQLSIYIEALNKPSNVRYIRDQISGNSVNANNHWVEIQAYKKPEWKPFSVTDNLCYQKSVTGNQTISLPEKITDGSIATAGYAYVTNAVDIYAQVDMGKIYPIHKFTVWHYYGDTRYYIDNIRSISKNGDYWYKVFDSNLEGTYYETSIGHIINLTEFNGNCSKVETGLPVESQFINLVNTTHGALGIWPYAYGWGSATNIQYGYVEDESTPTGTTKAVFVSWESSDGSDLGMRLAASDTVYGISSSTVYTVSIFKKNVKGITAPISSVNNIYIREYDSSGNQLREHGEAIYYETMENGWYRIWGTFTTQSATDHMAIQMYDYTPATCEVRLYGSQLIKQTEYPRVCEFTEKYKLDTFLYLHIPGHFKYGTIMGKFLPRTAFTNDPTYSNSANNSVLIGFKDEVNNNLVDYRYYVNGDTNSDHYGESVPFIAARDWIDGWSNIHEYYTIDSNKEIIWIAKKTSTSFSFQIIQDSVYKTEHSFTIDINNTEINKLIFGTQPIWNGTHYDINIYDEVLTTTEIEQLLKTKGSIKKSGIFLVKQINELGENLWPLTELSTSISYTVSGHGTVTYQNDELGEYHQTTFTDTDGVYKGFDITTISGKYYVFSGWFWQSLGNTFDYYPCVIEHEESGNEIRSSTFSNSPYEKWFYGWSIAQAGSTGNLRCLIYPMRVGYDGSGTLKWRNISFREATPTEIKMIGDGTFQCGDLSDF